MLGSLTFLLEMRAFFLSYRHQTASTYARIVLAVFFSFVFHGLWFLDFSTFYLYQRHGSLSFQSVDNTLLNIELVSAPSNTLPATQLLVPDSNAELKQQLTKIVNHTHIDRPANNNHPVRNEQVETYHAPTPLPDSAEPFFPLEELDQVALPLDSLEVNLERVILNESLKIVVEVYIDKNGNVKKINFFDELMPVGLKEAIEQALLETVFTPALRENVKVGSRKLIEFAFEPF